MKEEIELNHLNSFWLHYLSLEKSLIEISDYVAFTSSNVNTYSLKIMQLYFAICTETESVFEQIYKNVNKGSTKKSNIDRNMKMLTDTFPNIRECMVSLNVTGEALEFKPFDPMFHNYEVNQKDKKGIDNEVKRKRSWWRQYNTVKHERLEKFDQANLGNLLEALAALHILNIIYAISLDTQSIKDYNTTFILTPSEYQPPVFRIKNSSVLQIADKGRYYVCHMNHKTLDLADIS